MATATMEDGSRIGGFVRLFLMGLVGVIVLVPTISALLRSQIAQNPELVLPPLPVLLLVSLVQSAVLMAVAVGIGLYLTPRVGLHSRVVDGTPFREWIGTDLRPALLLGVPAALGVLLLDTLLFAPALDDAVLTIASQEEVGLLAGFVGGLLYGGITEEILLRWGFMTVVVWIGWRLFQKGQALPRPGVMWGAILVAALLFGLGHLPATAAVMTVTPLVVARALLLNGLLAVVYGWLFWRYSLEAAMLGHASFHVMALVVTLLVGG